VKFTGFGAAFLETYLAQHPEEATTLGVAGHDERWSDVSPAGIAAELAALRTAVVETRQAVAGEDDAARLDREAIARAAGFHARFLERELHLSNAEYSAFPNAALHLHAKNARTPAEWMALATRCAAVPQLLAQHEDNLRRGARAGELPDRDVVETMVTRVLPGAASNVVELPPFARHRGIALEDPTLRALEEGAAIARDAFEAHARFLADEILPLSTATRVLGEAEVTWRLEHTFGLAHSAHDLERRALEELAGAHADMMHHAGILAGGTLAEVRTPLLALWSACPKHADAVEPLYRRHLEAAVRFVTERSLFRVPLDFELGIEALPAGIADGTNATNWPAPLCDRSKRGFLLLSPDPADHPLVAVKQLSVHEGIPGHYLQSLVWQRAHAAAGTRAPVRFLGIADAVAASRGYFGAMLSIEGYAVYAERALRRAGFYDAPLPGTDWAKTGAPEQLFFAWCNAFRAVRVLLDLRLQSGAMTTGEATRFVQDATLMPEGWARAQVLRALRIPLQGLTYLLGCLEIEALHADAEGLARAAGAPFDAMAFHDAFFDAGPVPPGTIRR
jgi:uncharacterized protein (DUF885 family)